MLFSRMIIKRRKAQKNRYKKCDHAVLIKTAKKTIRELKPTFLKEDPVIAVVHNREDVKLIGVHKTVYLPYMYESDYYTAFHILLEYWKANYGIRPEVLDEKDSHWYLFDDKSDGYKVGISGDNVLKFVKLTINEETEAEETTEAE